MKDQKTTYLGTVTRLSGERFILRTLGNNIVQAEEISPSPMTITMDMNKEDTGNRDLRSLAKERLGMHNAGVVFGHNKEHECEEVVFPNVTFTKDDIVGDVQTLIDSGFNEFLSSLYESFMYCFEPSTLIVDQNGVGWGSWDVSCALQEIDDPDLSDI